MTSLVQTAQAVHATLQEIEGLYAKALTLTLTRHHHAPEFIENIFVNTKNALEEEAERLDRLLMSGKTDDAESESKPTTGFAMLKTISRLDEYAEMYGFPFTEVSILQAVQNNDSAFVQYLLNVLQTIPTSHYSPIHTAFLTACEKGYAEIVQLLLEDGRMDPSTYNNSAIISAVQKGQIEIVRLLLQDPRVDPSARTNFAFRWVCENGHTEGHTEIVRILLADPRVDPIAADNYAFVRACAYERIETVRLLLQDPRVNPTENDNHVFFYACENGYIEIVRLLLQDPRIDPTAFNNWAFRIACAKSQTEIVRLLLENKQVGDFISVNKAELGLAILKACSDSNTNVARLIVSDSRFNSSAINIESVIQAVRNACFTGNGNMASIQLLFQIWGSRINKYYDKDE
jgi:ankyrin repeat protein